MALALRFAEEGEYSSRACVLSYEDEPVVTPAKAIFRWSKSVRDHLGGASSVAVKRLLVATDGSPQRFLEALTTNWQLVGTLIVTDQAILPTTLSTRPATACQILSPHPVDHASFGADMAVIMPQEVSNGSIWRWTQALHAHLPAEEVIVFDSQLSTIYDFGGYANDGEPMIRMLSSASARDAKFERLVPALETPRYTTGIAAALLTQGELRRRRVRAFISLRSAHTTVDESARSFGPLVSLLDLPVGSPAALLPTLEDEFNVLYT
ncbi:hypothetical protein Poli38472_013628 [Pythium oligandrum]|uniref:Proteasome assembly chaperone 1 n=1 Tax=Pythium oligandrum TaxID=41045 RepID=A0A8K1CDI0_PYTOL|nr:hypothetical protein Poli38472_013628 [Pythium oligandrum]|eukprot:TMW61165.1 hypothetical protein Poli38472_013628 [Pythium oligandrum]